MGSVLMKGRRRSRTDQREKSMHDIGLGGYKACLGPHSGGGQGELETENQGSASIGVKGKVPRVS